MRLIILPSAVVFSFFSLNAFAFDYIQYSGWYAHKEVIRESKGETGDSCDPSKYASTLYNDNVSWLNSNKPNTIHYIPSASSATCRMNVGAMNRTNYTHEAYYYTGDVNDPDYMAFLNQSDIPDGDFGGAADFSEYDSECEAVKPDFVSLPDGLAPVGNSFSWDYDGCTFTTSSLWIQEPSGDWSSTVLSAEAIQPDPPIESGETSVPESGEDSSSKYVLSNDVSNDCPYSNVSYGGDSYCYVGSDAPQGQSYPDDSERIDHYDGSYTVVDSGGSSTDYNADGSLKNPTTAPVLPGQGPSGSGSGGGVDGCPPWAPSWMCAGSGDGSGVGDGDGDLVMPVQVIDPSSSSVDYDSGLSTSGSCPQPVSVTLPLYSAEFEVSYQGFCDFASMIRSLVIAAAYMSSAFLVFRGLT